MLMKTEPIYSPLVRDCYLLNIAWNVFVLEILMSFRNMFAITHQKRYEANMLYEREKPNLLLEEEQVNFLYYIGSTLKMLKKTKCRVAHLELSSGAQMSVQMKLKLLLINDCIEVVNSTTDGERYIVKIKLP